MGNQIQILGLIVMFLLIVFYWFRTGKYNDKDNIYKYLLVITYIFTLSDIACLVAKCTNNYMIFYQKIYLFLSLEVYLALPLYILNTFFKEKYYNQSSCIRQKTKTLNYLYGSISLMNLLLIFFGVFSLKKLLNSIIFIILSIYLFFSFFLLFRLNKELKPRTLFHFWIITFINSVMLVFQYYLSNMGFLTIGSIVIVLYLYLTLENMGIEELENLRIENAYNKEQNIDKVAFLKNISHEIRTPINTIDGFSQIILNNDNLEEVKKDTEDIRIASRDLIDVINGMIDLSIIESGELEILPESYNVYDMFDSIIEIVKSKLREKKVKFIVEIEKDIPEVLLGDSERISQVILNLLKTSVKSTDKGNITLKVSRVKSENLCRLKIEILDTGKGFKQEEIEHVFDKKDTENQGNLNLAVTNYLVQKMNGTLEIESTYLEKTHFIVTIDQKIISEKQPSSSKKEKVVKPFKASTKKVLIVDDNKLNLKVASRLLKPYDVKITEASSGQECLDILEQNHDFDLILMDDLMPGLSGTETMKLIKKIARIDGYYIPIVAVTANATSGQKEKYLENGFDDYLSKPIDYAELNRLLKKYLKGNLSK